MKKLFAAVAALGCSFAAPLDAMAIPTYAYVIARDHCEYLAAGWTWDDSIAQAMSDNQLWLDEMRADGDRSSSAIALAIHKRCYELNNTAFTNR